MSEPNIEAMREAVRRDAARTFTEDELRDELIQYGACQTCGAARTGKMTEPEPGQFRLDGVCTADETHEAW